MKPLLFLLILLPLAFSAEAANSYKVNAGATVSINEHGTCRRIKNNKSVALFVPTKTSAEWSAFRSGSGSGASLTNCSMKCTMASGKWCDNPRNAGNIIRTSNQSSLAACVAYCEATSGVDVCEYYSDNKCFAWGPCTLGDSVGYAGKCVLQ